MANPLTTGALNLSAKTLPGIWTKNIRSGALARLATEDPEIRPGDTDIFTFTKTPKAQLVAEAGNKSSMDATPAKVTANTHKVQITYRVTDEVLTASEEYQLRVLDMLMGAVAKGLSRAVDTVAFHGVNPLTGEVAESVSSYFTKSGNGVTTINVGSDKPYESIDKLAEAIQANGYSATGIGLDPSFSGALARCRNNDGQLIYPGLGFGFNIDNFEGISAAVSDTISGTHELANPELRAIIGDFDAFKWGIVGNVPFEVIRYGNPDGLGDLKQTNQVAFRAEARFAYAILDPKAFAILKGSALPTA